MEWNSRCTSDGAKGGGNGAIVCPLSSGRSFLRRRACGEGSKGYGVNRDAHKLLAGTVWWVSAGRTESGSGTARIAEAKNVEVLVAMARRVEWIEGRNQRGRCLLLCPRFFSRAFFSRVPCKPFE